jgi:cytochrome bd-type quinol oxidase subunit 2
MQCWRKFRIETDFSCVTPNIRHMNFLGSKKQRQLFVSTALILANILFLHFWLLMDRVSSSQTSHQVWRKDMRSLSLWTLVFSLIRLFAQNADNACHKFPQLTQKYLMPTFNSISLITIAYSKQYKWPTLMMTVHLYFCLYKSNFIIHYTLWILITKPELNRDR